MNKQTWLIVGLVVSIAFNMLFVGIVVGRTIFGGPPPHMQWMMQDVGEETRRTVHQAMRETAEQTESTRKSLRRAQRELHKTIRAEEYDKEAVAQALSEVRRLTNEMQEIMHGQMVESLEMMAPEERLHVVRKISGARPGPRGPGGPKRGREG